MRSDAIALLCLAGLGPSSLLEAYEVPPPEPGFVSLFDGKDLTRDFVIKGNPASWKVVDGTIVAVAGGDRIMSKEKYDNFVLRLEWKVTKFGNSGIFIRVPSQDDGRSWETGFEVQISNERDSSGKGRDNSHCTGSLYGIQDVNPRPDDSPDVWHSYEITCVLNKIRVKVDGTQVTDADYEKIPAMRQRPLRGYVGLQDAHAKDPGSKVEYRNLRIQRLNADGLIPGFTSISNDPSRWRKIKTGHGAGGLWTHAGGVWTGQQDPPGSGNGGVNVTDATYGDFELIAEVQPCWGCDSGIFLRSTGEGSCYQIMVDYYAGGNVGGIYGEGLVPSLNARNYNFEADGTVKPISELKDVLPLATDPASWPHWWRKDDFNEVRARIRSNPPTIDVWVNGLYLTHFVDTEKRLPDRGAIGLQVHGGKSWPAEGKVAYRNLFVRELK